MNILLNLKVFSLDFYPFFDKNLRIFAGNEERGLATGVGTGAGGMSCSVSIHCHHAYTLLWRLWVKVAETIHFNLIFQFIWILQMQ